MTIGRDELIKAVDDGLTEQVKARFSTFCAGVAGGDPFDAALERFSNGVDQLIKAYTAAVNSIATKETPS